jgi:hypothetical protein
MNNAPVLGRFTQKMQGKYNVKVVDSKTKEVVKDYGWQPNLILNQGMDSMSLFALAEVTVYGLCGSGSRPNKITSSTSTITQSGNIITLWPEAGGLQNFTSSITASSPYEVYYSSSLEAGDWIVYANASRSAVVEVDVAGLSASVSNAYTIESGSNQTFTIWKTSQTGLQKEGKKSSTYLTGVGNCGRTNSSGSGGFANIRTFRRTYDFATESSSSNYTEVGVSMVSTARSGTFSRTLLPVPVTVAVGFQLRLIYDLEVEFGPTALQLFTASITGWTDTACSGSNQNLYTSDILTTGGATELFLALSEPGPDSPTGLSSRRSPVDTLSAPVHRSIFFSSVTSSLMPYGSGVARQAGTIYDEAIGAHTSPLYVTGSYTYTKTNFLTLNQANTTTQSGIWSIGFSAGGVDYVEGVGTSQVYVLLFHRSQSKANTQVASMSFVYTWDRVFAGT